MAKKDSLSFLWKVEVSGSVEMVEARNYGAACHKAFKKLIAAGKLKRQPKNQGGLYLNTTAIKVG